MYGGDKRCTRTKGKKEINENYHDEDYLHRIYGVGKDYRGQGTKQGTWIAFLRSRLYIKSRMHKTVKQIFDSVGEEGFREIERNMLHEVAEFEDVIISCGGGTPCFFDNIDYINQQGDTIYLKASPEVLYGHLKMGKTVRPLLLNKTPDEVREFIHDQLEQRKPFYEKAKYTLNVDLMDNYEKIKISVEKVKELLNIE